MKTSTVKRETKKATPANHFVNNSKSDLFIHKSSDNHQSFFNKINVQPKLTIGEAGDKYEQEADAMADKVMKQESTTQSSSLSEGNHSTQNKTDIQRQEKTNDKVINKELLQTKPLDVNNAGNGSVLAPNLSSKLNKNNGSGNKLPRSTNSFMSNAFGTDFGKVNTHTGIDAIQMNNELGARAFTHGSDIYFNKGEFDPDSSKGKRLIAHELTHVAQQRGAEKIIQASTTIVTKGAVQHTGAVTLPPGMQGPPVGNVEVRTGEEIELRPGSRIPNVISIEYTGALTTDSRWLQFVWFEMTAATPGGTARISGSIPTSSGVLPFTVNPASPTWAVDSGPNNPFYESGAVSLRNRSTTTIFDAAGGGSISPLAQAVFGSGNGATAVTFTAHFDTYLIQNNQAAYVVPYRASTRFTPPAAAGGAITVGAIGYTVGNAGPVTALPNNLRTILHTNYRSFRSIQ